MKAKFYTILTGLLMAAYITSFGQEIVCSFEYHPGKMFSYNDLQVCSDGSVLSGIYCYNPSNGQNTGFHVCKISDECQLINSTTFSSAWELFGIPGMPDIFILPDYQFDNENGSLSINMTHIDADLNITDEITTLLATGLNPNEFMEDVMFISPSGDLIVTYWMENVYNIARIGIDGTVKATNETSQLLPQNITGYHSIDSALYYTETGVFCESPELFYKLGGYIPENESDPWTLIAYIFDADLNLTETVVYGYVDGNSNCELAGIMDHITPVTRSTIKDTYLLAAQIHNADDTYLTSLIRYDKNHHVMSVANLEEPSPGMGRPIRTEVIDENTIYHTYNSFPYNYYSPFVGLARLDRDLNVVWNITLPFVANAMSYGYTLKVLPNGDVAVSMASGSSSSSTLYIYIIRDNDPTSVPETMVTETPFTPYPNPVNDQLTLRFDDGTEPESVELYDLAGRLVGTMPNGLESIDMRTMPSGVYMLHVTMKDGMIYHEKVLKE